jgi:hypothetical protein
MLRPFKFPGTETYELNVPYAVGGALLVGGALKLQALCQTQPFYSTQMNDLKAACAAGMVWNGIMVLAISILFKVLDGDKGDDGSYSDGLRLGLTIGFLVGLPVAMLVGARASGASRKSIIAKKYEAAKKLVEDQATHETENTPAYATEGKLANPSLDVEEQTCCQFTKCSYPESASQARKRQTLSTLRSPPDSSFAI